MSEEELTLEDFELPQYSFNFMKPVVGVGNFTTLAPKIVYCKDLDEKGFPCAIDRSIARKKIELWRKILASKILEITPEKGTINELYKAKAWDLFSKDKTIKAFHYFRFNAKPFETRYFQDVLLSDNSDRILMISSNQLGKSLTLDVDASTDFIKDHYSEWVGILVSKSLPQSRYQMSRIKQLLRSADIDVTIEETAETKTGKKDNSFEITYTFYDMRGKPLYTNHLICCPPTGSALGFPANKMWLDEFDFWENIDHEFFINQIAIPRTFDTEGTIFVFTNPNGKLAAWKLWNQVDDKGNHIWHRYEFNYWDSPNAAHPKIKGIEVTPQEGFNKKSAGMARARIESTLLAVFSSAGGAVFSNEEITDMKDPELIQKGDFAGLGRETAWFLDVGSVHDQSVLVGGFLEHNTLNPDIPIIKQFYTHKYPVGYPLGRVVGIEIKEIDGWEEDSLENPSVREVLQRYAVDEVTVETQDIHKIFNQPLFGYDITGNQGMRTLFQTANIDAIDITFSGKRKWYMYQRAQYYAQQRLYKRNPDRDLNTINNKDGDYQFSRLVITENTRTVYRQVHHASEEDYDDVPDASVGLINLIENPDLPTLQYDIINQGKSIYAPIEKEDPNETELQKRDRILKDQYIPKHMRGQEFDSWMERKMENRR